MIQRLDTTGHMPIVEYRSFVDRYFVVFPDLNAELAPAFANKWTAREIAINSFYGVPFFMMIPAVPYGTVYPRPGFLMPQVIDLEIELRIR